MFEDLTHFPYLAGLISWVRGEPASAYSSFVLEAFKWAEVLMTIVAGYFLTTLLRYSAQTVGIQGKQSYV